MYSIAVKNLPKKATEAELIAHFNKLSGQKDSVVAVSYAYGNTEEINANKKRGELIRAKIHLVHVSLSLTYHIYVCVCLTLSLSLSLIGT